MAKFVFYGKYCDKAIEKRKPFRDEHLARLSSLKEEGFLITLGPSKCTKVVFGIFEGKSIEEVRKIIEDDIYWEKGIWTSIDVYSWVQAF